MTAVPGKVLQWLYNSLKPNYQYVDRTYADVAQALQQHNTLGPRTDVYTFENGASALLLLLEGTLSVPFRGTAYRFPVTAWLPHAYPREPPMVYVTPAQDMVIRPGQHVSIEGKIYHPYLAHWASHWTMSNLVDFLSIIRDVFAKEPPVISTQQQQQPPSQSKSPTRQETLKPPPVPPPPEELRRNKPQAPDGPSSTSTPPPPPPKPPEVSTSGATSANSHNIPGNRPMQSPPALPPKPIQPNGESSYQSNHRGGEHLRAPATGGPDVQNVRRSADAQFLPRSDQFAPPSSYEHGFNPVPAPVSSHESSTGGPPLQHQPAFVQQQYQQILGAAPPRETTFYTPRMANQPAGVSFQPPVVAPRKPLEDLLSSSVEVESLHKSAKGPSEPAPPIPPNPEKDAILTLISSALRTGLSQTVSQNNAAIPALEAQQSAMQHAYNSMQDELSQLQQLDAMLASNEKILHESMREADRVLDSVRQREVPTVDDVLVAPTVVGEQLYGLVAEERGMNDALFALTRALDNGRIDGDVFVKQTRSLAREQFLRKALIKKIAKGMGLDTESFHGI